MNCTGWSHVRFIGFVMILHDRSTREVLYAALNIVNAAQNSVDRVRMTVIFIVLWGCFLVGTRPPCSGSSPEFAVLCRSEVMWRVRGRAVEKGCARESWQRRGRVGNAGTLKKGEASQNQATPHTPYDCWRSISHVKVFEDTVMRRISLRWRELDSSSRPSRTDPSPRRTGGISSRRAGLRMLYSA